jgi:hypothetical protein
MNFVEHLMERSASRWASATRVGMKYPRSRPSLIESFVSMADASAISIKCAKSPGLNRPKPSAMFLVLDAAESRICARNEKSLAAGPVGQRIYFALQFVGELPRVEILVSSDSSHAATLFTQRATLHDVCTEPRTPNPEPRAMNPEPRTSNPNAERRTSNAERHAR